MSDIHTPFCRDGFNQRSARLPFPGDRGDGKLRHVEVLAFAQGDYRPFDEALHRIKRADRVVALSACFADADFEIHLSDGSFTAYRIIRQTDNDGQKVRCGVSVGFPMGIDPICDYFETGVPTATDLLKGIQRRWEEVPF